MKHRGMCRGFQVVALTVLAGALPLASQTPQSLPPDGPAIPTISLTGGPASQEPKPTPADQQSQWNMELEGFNDLQGRSAYQPIIINENGREIAYVGHHTGSAMNPPSGCRRTQRNVDC